MDSQTDFLAQITTSIESGRFIKITLSNSRVKHEELLNTYIRLIDIKRRPHLSFTYHYRTNDQVKNHDIPAGLAEIGRLMDDTFKNAMLFTSDADFLLQLSKKGKASLKELKPSHPVPTANARSHDNPRKKQLAGSEKYLRLLGVADTDGQIIPRMADKYRQINKYLEVMEDLIDPLHWERPIHIVDMGSGKGYLTFALYDYLKNKKNMDVRITGIEMRPDLVAACNASATACGFENLHFVANTIQNHPTQQTDILIALHACDTATDDAIAQGIRADASLIVCAPCCHKHVRQQLKGKEQTHPLLRHGIFKERQYEMITDTLRALILEKHSYKTKIFEFVSNEHTRKNIMLVGSRASSHTADPKTDLSIEAIKEEYGLDYHYLEKLV